jgi:uncharacterized SAM-binding protein YcdF (DUF218 family)
VVLGCAVHRGGRPSPSLARRARLGATLYRAGRAPRIVFTGGVGRHPPSEARVACAAAGLAPSEGVLLDERSTTTGENAREARRLLPGARRILVVSDAYHLPRARRVFARRFAEVATAGTVGRLDGRARGATREVFALAWDAVTRG